MLQENYPNRLFYHRRRKRLSQKQLAALLGYQDRTMISKYERGHVLPPFDVLVKLECLYETHVPDLFPRDFSRFKAELVEVAESMSVIPKILN